MRLSELVSQLGTTTFQIVATLIFVAVFLAITVRTLRPAARAEQARARELPLEDDHV